jgi:hypothetical protein
VPAESDPPTPDPVPAGPLRAWWRRLSLESKLAVLTLVAAACGILAQLLVGADDIAHFLDRFAPGAEAAKVPSGGPSVPATTAGPSASTAPEPTHAADSPTPVPSGASRPEPSRIPPPPSPAAPPAAGLRLQVFPGRAYDLDPGIADSTREAHPDDPRDRFDLVRTKVDTPGEQDRVSGVNREGSNQNAPESFNPIFRLDSARSRADCQARAISYGGNVVVSTLAPGSRLCVRTRQGRWVLLTVELATSNVEEPLTVRIGYQ